MSRIGSAPANPFRLNMPRHERQHRWLPLLLDCYAVIDASVQQALDSTDKALACHVGCTACCRHTIPLSTLEALGLKFAVENLLDAHSRTSLSATAPHSGGLCCFNHEGACTVYALRPIACRRYLVTGQPCERGEAPLDTRPDAVLQPSRRMLRQAVALTLPFYAAIGLTPQAGEDVLAFYLRQNVPLTAVWSDITGREAG
ncbi:MAG: YkgJ family cysteine cluster protein [Desulfovibrionaceae bacterium]|nr:YkgJ family cysteine cluster protein [Desulfovibrionaceae bacterium]